MFSFMRNMRWSSKERTARCTDFSNKLDDYLNNCERSTPFGFILSGHSRRVTFWCSGKRLILFNPHCVDINNSIATRVQRGAARLFEGPSSFALAAVAFRSDLFDGYLWSVFKVTLQVSGKLCARGLRFRFFRSNF